MIKKLRRKFILTTMAILTVLFAVIIAALNYSFAQVGVRQNMDFLRIVAQGAQTQAAIEARPAAPDTTPNNTLPAASMHHSFSIWDELNSMFFHSGRVTSSHDASAALLSPIYTVQVDSEGCVSNLSGLSSSADVDNTALISVINTIVQAERDEGKIGDYRYCRAAQDGYDLIALMDTSQSMETLTARRLLFISVMFGCGALVLLFFVSCWLSRFVTKPAEETFNKQKQFISDASHELKTPLSVISINADVLSSEIGPNKYMDYIKSETQRMDGLIHQLLELSRMEDASRPLIKTVFDLSEALYQIALPFESTAFEHQIAYDMVIDANVRCNGEAESIKQLAAILLDNAFKNTPDAGKIEVQLKAHGTDCQLTVTNTGCGIAAEDLPHIFERFYRCDKSRTRSGTSYGLGLAIAQSIATAHGGEIKAESIPNQYTRFTVIL